MSGIRNLFKRSEDSEGLKLKALELFYTDKLLAMKTVLTKDEIKQIIKLEMKNDFIKSKLNIDLRLKIFTKLYKLHRVSENGLGRIQGIDVLKSGYSETESRDTQSSLVKRMIGVR